MRHLVIVLVVVFFACDGPLGSGPLSSADPFTPPPIYAQWWHELELCVGRFGDINRVSWYRVKGGPFQWRGDTRFGLWKSPHDIYIAEGHELIEPDVKHEMIHDLTGGRGHSHEAFGVCEVAHVNSSR